MAVRGPPRARRRQHLGVYAEPSGKLVVAFQRAWNGEVDPRPGICGLGADSSGETLRKLGAILGD